MCFARWIATADGLSMRWYYAREQASMFELIRIHRLESAAR
jgi:hypothetical protein